MYLAKIFRVNGVNPPVSYTVCTMNLYYKQNKSHPHSVQKKIKQELRPSRRRKSSRTRKVVKWTGTVCSAPHIHIKYSIVTTSEINKSVNQQRGGKPSQYVIQYVVST
jgi:hypothetical protein